MIMNQVTSNQRIIAALIDYIPILIISMIGGIISFFVMYPIFYDIFANSSNIRFMDDMMILMRYSISISVILMVLNYSYYLCKDLFGGQSMGKRMRKLQIVRKNGSGPVSNARLVLRNLFVFIYIVEFVMYFIDPSQRLGDKACDTMVVNADESNAQPYDKGKVVLTILIVFLCLCVFAAIYYFVMIIFFEQYFQMIDQMTMQNSYQNM